ncbi:type VII secretion target [Mycobacterium sp. IS-3022]|uniref:ESX-1 secretion-associated protein n=1 Tax=Mycobacterium sp. IS-3022 TaxID=1772277 RepID=UPI00074156E4|nr:type VII secretion target [Mycobacterium sp. IS-3022]
MSQLNVQTDAVRSYAQIHDRVATDLSQVIDADASEAAGVQASHGTIAAAVGAALTSALGTRRDTVQATARSGETLSELLREAARMYDDGDQAGADKLRAAADALDSQQGAPGGTSGPVGAVGPAAATGSPAGGDQMAGQLAGQIGQQVGQAVGGLTASLAGLAQGLVQVPQQVMQAVQGAAGSTADDKARREAYDEADRTQDAGGAEESPTRDRAQHTERAVEGQPVDRADAGAAASGRTPDVPAEPQRPQPAQTRPQGDWL